MRRRHADVLSQAIETKLLLSVDEAAALMSVGRSLVYDLVRRHELVSVKVGRVRRIPAKAIHDYVGRQLACAE